MRFTVPNFASISVTIPETGTGTCEELPDLLSSPSFRADKGISGNTSEWFIPTFNTFLGGGIFPKLWKKKTLVLLPKRAKRPGEPWSYRPFCSLGSIKKLLEYTVCNRLLAIVEEARWYGFPTDR